jgi:hypothetical protein
VRHIAMWLVVSFSSVGCMGGGFSVPIPKIITNIPYNSTTVTIQNACPDLKLLIVHDGMQAPLVLETGQHTSVNLRNFGQYQAVASFMITARDATDKFIGTVVRQVTYDGYGRDSVSWVVRPSDFGR